MRGKRVYQSGLVWLREGFLTRSRHPKHNLRNRITWDQNYVRLTRFLNLAGNPIGIRVQSSGAFDFLTEWFPGHASSLPSIIGCMSSRPSHSNTGHDQVAPAQAVPSHTAPSTAVPSRAVLGWEIAIVLALSLGKSGVYALIDLLDTITRGPISSGTAALNTSTGTRPWIDLLYQLAGIFFALAPVALVIYLVSRWPGNNPLRRWGIDGRRWGTDAAVGVGFFVLIGVGTLGVYAAGRALGITTAITTSGLPDVWWSIPVLLLAALKNGLLEEIVVLAYLHERLSTLKWGPAAIILFCAVVRGSYHLYQGIGPFIGNVAMGMIFGMYYLRKRRVMPLIWAHFLLDAVAFVGYPLLAAWFGYGG